MNKNPSLLVIIHDGTHQLIDRSHDELAEGTLQRLSATLWLLHIGPNLPKKEIESQASLNKGYRFLTWDWNLCASPNFFVTAPKQIPQRHVQNLNQLTSFHPPSSWHWRKSHPTCVASSSPSPHPSSEHRSWQIAPQSGWYVDKSKLKRSFVSEMLQSPPQVAYHFYQPIFSSHDLNL